MAKRKFVIKAEWEKEWVGDNDLDTVAKIKCKQISQITETQDEHGNTLKVKNVRVTDYSIKEVEGKIHFDASVKCEVIETN